MQFSTIVAFAAAALSAALSVSASEADQLTTIWVPTATVVVTNTYTGTRVEEIWTDVPPYEMDTTFPITWTATQTSTEYMSIVTSVPDRRRHARDFEQS